MAQRNRAHDRRTEKAINTLVGILVDSLSDAAILSLACIAFSLQFSVTGYVNFAFGQYLTLGALVSVFVSGPLHQSLWVSLAASGVCVAILSYGVGQYIYAPFFRRQPHVLYILVIGFGLAVILGGIYELIWRGNIYVLPFLNGDYQAGIITISKVQVLALAAALMTIGLILGLLRYTRTGKSMRAVADNPTLANISGLNSRKVVAYTWVLTGFIVGIAGVIQALQARSFDISLGDTFLYLIIVAVVVSGIGRPLACVVGAFIVALGEQISVYVVGSDLAPVGVFAVLVILILFRPAGLLGGKTTLQNA